jgi:AraC family transcriptional regulator of adaptative response/methylated-DNA-[protein]-cysteine methyltransferase
MLVGATERGVCAVTLGRDEEPLVAELQREFPNATLERDEASIAEWVSAIVRHLEGEASHPEVPMDLRGTDFQLRVWKALREIPYGETRTYSDIAIALGQPSAARAVARACATNKVALLVPCHRVVRESGALAGYRWGLERKRRLLEQERSVASPRPAEAPTEHPPRGPSGPRT